MMVRGLIAGLAVLSVLAGCGRKGDPVPPGPAPGVEDATPAPEERQPRE